MSRVSAAGTSATPAARRRAAMADQNSSVAACSGGKSYIGSAAMRRPAIRWATGLREDISPRRPCRLR
jgi:hypothetical protein